MSFRAELANLVVPEVATDSYVRCNVDVITVEGPDAAAYLDGQLSQRLPETGSSAWTLLLEPNGKLVAWLTIARLADERFIFVGDPGIAEAATARLQRFKLRVDATIEATSTTATVVVHPSDPTAGIARDFGGLTTRWFLDGVNGPAGVLGRELGIDEVAALRIAAHWPVHGAELSAGTIAAEANIVEPSVSFTKGCYTGQELIARIDSRGSNVAKQLQQLRFDGDDAGAVGASWSDGGTLSGAHLVIDGDIVGTVTSYDPTTKTGLGYIGRKAAEATTFDVQSGNSDAAADTEHGV